MNLPNNVVALGPEYSYSHNVAKKIIIPGSGIGIDLVNIPKRLMEEVSQYAGDIIASSMGNLSVIKRTPSALAGVIPVHNQFWRTVNCIPEAIYQILNNYNATSLGWKSYKIEHTLAGLEGTDIDYLRSVHSHIQALSQCKEEGFKRLSGDPRIVVEQSTVAHIPNLKLGEAVICSREAAEAYNLIILDPSFGPKNNSTDFIVLTVNKGITGFQDLENDKALLVLSMEDETGRLAEVLAVLADAGIDMSTLHSQTKCKGKIDFIVVTKTICDWDNLKKSLNRIGCKIRIL